MDRNFDEIDNMFFDYFSDKSVPNIIENGIATAMYKECNSNKIARFIKEGIIAIISLLALSSGIVFAKDIERFFKNVFGIREGIETAVQNGYISNQNMEYVESNNVKIKVDDILVDDYNLSINFNVNPNVNVSEINDIYLSQILIVDDNKSILYCESEDLFNKYCSENELDYEYMNFNKKYINNGFNYKISKKDSDTNTLNLIYNFSAYDYEYDKSKNLEIYINEINYKTNKNEKVKGEWKMDVKDLEKFYKRSAIEYKQKESNDENVKIVKATVYDTELRLELEIYDEEQGLLKDINMLDLRKAMQKELSAYNRSEKKQKKVFIDGKQYYIGPATEEYMRICAKLYEPVEDIYIENENGEKFYMTENTSEDKSIDRIYERNLLKYTNTFDLTKYNVTDKLKICFKYAEEEKIIEIEK